MSFKSWDSYREFTHKVRHGQRYIHDDDIKEFLEEIERTSSDRVRLLEDGSDFFRAQIGNNWCKDDTPSPHDIARMFPQKLQAIEGRANPKGIPYLYMSTDKQTAMSEVRPWVGVKVSVAELKTTRLLKVIDCSVNMLQKPFYDKEPEDIKKEESVWSMIDHAFSKPVAVSHDTAEYVPTQIISEMFKANGYDGILYKSMFADGYNMVVFDVDAAELLSCSLYETQTVELEFDECAVPYFVGNNK
jgi:hypothetical protein